MHVPCENTNSPCPVILPITCPPPRCDCQEDRSTPRHCRLCHLPFDIENRLQPDSGLQVFCSCFLGASRVLFPIPFLQPLYWVLVPICPSIDSGRSSMSSLSAASDQSLPSTVEAYLDECNNSLQKHCSGDTLAECDH